MARRRVPTGAAWGQNPPGPESRCSPWNKAVAGASTEHKWGYVASWLYGHEQAFTRWCCWGPSSLPRVPVKLLTFWGN